MSDSLITFSNAPPGADIRIYTLSGERIKGLSAGADGRAFWNAANEAGRRVASGVYFALIQSGGGKKKLKIAIVR